ncbi:MAG TPA: hypothetical protein VIL51_06855, partial [Thermoleophilia bacterium]
GPWSPPENVRRRFDTEMGGKRAASSAAGLNAGDQVQHAKFGIGVVLGMEPGGVVRIFFSELGEQKRLLLDYAPLKRL